MSVLVCGGFDKKYYALSDIGKAVYDHMRAIVEGCLMP